MRAKQLNVFLDDLQARQAEHDGKYRRDVLDLSITNRVRHFLFYLVEYNVAFALEREKKQQKRALVDAFIVTLAFANAIEVKLSFSVLQESDFRSRLNECRLRRVKFPLTRARFLILVRKLAYKGAHAFKRGYASILGKLAKDLKERERHPELWREYASLKSLVADLFMLILYEAARHKFDIFKAAEQRRKEQEKNHVPIDPAPIARALLN